MVKNLRKGQRIRYLGGRNDTYIKIGSLGTVIRYVDNGLYAKWDESKIEGDNNWYVEVSEIEVVQDENQKEANPQHMQLANKGLRYNSNKLRWRNFPMFLMEPLIEVAQYGESKYDTFNFLKGQTVLDSLDSLKRHLTSFENPYEPDEDKESKVNHLAHVAWNALVAVHMMKTRPDMDDRHQVSEEDIKAYAEEIQKRGR